VGLSACTDPYDPGQRPIGDGLFGAGTGAAIGGIAGDGHEAATGALMGEALGAVGGAATTPSPGYYGRSYYGSGYNGFWLLGIRLWVQLRRVWLRCLWLQCLWLQWFWPLRLRQLGNTGMMRVSGSEGNSEASSARGDSPGGACLFCYWIVLHDAAPSMRTGPISVHGEIETSAQTPRVGATHKKRIFAGAVATLLIIGSKVPRPAHAQSAPAGSYRGSCTDVGMEDRTLTAVCRIADGT
jgi:hypothetical protein